MKQFIFRFLAITGGITLVIFAFLSVSNYSTHRIIEQTKLPDNLERVYDSLCVFINDTALKHALKGLFVTLADDNIEFPDSVLNHFFFDPQLLKTLDSLGNL